MRSRGRRRSNRAHVNHAHVGRGHRTNTTPNKRARAIDTARANRAGSMERPMIEPHPPSPADGPRLSGADPLAGGLCRADRVPASGSCRASCRRCWPHASRPLRAGRCTRDSPTAAARHGAARRRSSSPALMVVFVLAPLVFAFGALLGEAHALLLRSPRADQRGLRCRAGWKACRWSALGAGRAGRANWRTRAPCCRWRSAPTRPALLGWPRSLGQFTGHHAVIIGFAILLLFVLYRDGEVARAGRQARAARSASAAASNTISALGTRAVRASVNSMLVVGLFDGLASAAAFAIAGVPNAAVWAAITGALALVPFLGYVAVVALALHLPSRARARGVDCAGARLRHPARRRQGRAAGGGARRGRSAVSSGC